MSKRSEVSLKCQKTNVRMCNSIILSALVNSVWSTLNQTLGEFSQLMGIRQEGRIVGGRDIRIEKVPYQVSLQRYGEHQCGGAIISPRWVITAGHCVKGFELDSISVRAGTSNVYSGGSVHKVVSATYHPSFNQKNYDYDVGVVKVHPPFILGKHMKAIKLPKAKFKPLEGAGAVVTGWGTLSSEGKVLPAQLQSIQLPIVGRRKCQRAFSFLEVTSRMICAGYVEGRRDACQGDSGGPMKSMDMLVGIVSWGVGCASAGRFGVYSNVAKFRTWIQQKTGV